MFKQCGLSSKDEVNKFFEQNPKFFEQNKDNENIQLSDEDLVKATLKKNIKVVKLSVLYTNLKLTREYKPFYDVELDKAILKNYIECKFITEQNVQYHKKITPKNDKQKRYLTSVLNWCEKQIDFDDKIIKMITESGDNSIEEIEKKMEICNNARNEVTKAQNDMLKFAKQIHDPK